MAKRVWAGLPGPERPLDVFALGEISLDRVVEVDRLPAPGCKAIWRSEEQRPGGQIATAALACSRLGLRVAYATAVGEDRAAAQALWPLEDAGVALDAVQRSPAVATRQAIVLVESGGERSVLERRDPRAVLDTGRLDRKSIESARLLLLDATDLDAALWAAGVAAESQTVVVLDADTPVPGLQSLLDRTDFPVISQSLTCEIGGTASIRDGLRVLRAGGARAAVATLGPLGALGLGPEGEVKSPAFEVDALDSTGAGDAFHAGFVAALLAGCELPAVLRRANAVGALNCTGRGAQGGLPSATELEGFLRKARQRPWRDAE